jgi:hypothetical protein
MVPKAEVYRVVGCILGREEFCERGRGPSSLFFFLSLSPIEGCQPGLTSVPFKVRTLRLARFCILISTSGML